MSEIDDFSQFMTLAAILLGARRLSIVEKLQLIQMLAADVDISPLEPFKADDVQDRLWEVSEVD